MRIQECTAKHRLSLVVEFPLLKKLNAEVYSGPTEKLRNNNPIGLLAHLIGHSTQESQGTILTNELWIAQLHTNMAMWV